MILGFDYAFRNDIKTNNAAIVLLTGPFKDVTFTFEGVRVVEKSDEAIISFGYEIQDVSRANVTMTSLMNNEEFDNTLKTVLHALLIEALDEEQNIDAERESNNQEPVNE